jgi:hypothetical protein
MTQQKSHTINKTSHLKLFFCLNGVYHKIRHKNDFKISDFCVFWTLLRLQDTLKYLFETFFYKGCQ